MHGLQLYCRFNRDALSDAMTLFKALDGNDFCKKGHLVLVEIQLFLPPTATPAIPG